MLGKHLQLFVLLSIVASPLFGQEAIPPRPSPLAVVACKYKDTYLKIVYNQPHKRGREVFGKLVPFGQVWRLGANEATEITITKDVFVGGQLLTTGTYSMFAIPDKEKWTIIFNKELGLWGSYNYNQAKDALRIDVPSSTLPGDLAYEAFTVTIDQKTNKADIVIMWDKTRVTFNVDFIEPKP
jgi:Protein of unknown function (DUF2911)